MRERTVGDEGRRQEGRGAVWVGEAVWKKGKGVEEAVVGQGDMHKALGFRILG